MSMHLEYEIIASLRKIIRAVDIFSNRLKEKYGLNSTQITCLDYINNYGAKSISELGKQFHLSNSMLTNIIDQLESRAMVNRIRSDQDRRVVKIEITDHGRSIMQNAPTSLQKKLTLQLNKLAVSDREKILASLNTLINFIKAEDLDSTPILASGEKLFGEPESTIDEDGSFKPKD